MIVFKGGQRSASGLRTGLGKSFGGLVAYLTQGSRDAPNPERVAWTATRNLDGIEAPRDAAQLMRAHAGHHPRTAKPVYHFGLSLHEGEHLTPAQWNHAVDRVLDRMGLAQHQALLIAHRDTPREHVHVVVNRVGPDGRAWDPRRDMVKARAAVRTLEVDLGLLRTGPRDLPVPELTSGSYREALRTRQLPLPDRVREHAADLAAATSWSDLEARLAATGFRLTPAARGSGLLVTDGSRTTSMSRVDRSLSGPQLAHRFGETFRQHRAAHPEPPTIPAQGRQPDPLPGATASDRAEALLGRLTATRATFTEADLHRAAFHLADSAALVRDALQSPSLLDLGTDARGTRRYTSREYLDAEIHLLVGAARLSSRAELRLDPQTVSRALDRAIPSLADEQRAAVLHAATESDFAQIVGRAGAGKTTVASTLAAAYRDAGYQVRGAALAGKAAEVLEATTGVPSQTLASIEYARSQGRDPLPQRSILLVDEAGTIDVRQLARLLAYADERGAKVILLGDPDQLQAIAAGDAYRGLLDHHPSATLATIRRQQDTWQREASEQLATGRVPEALARYEDAGRLHWSGSPETSRADLLAAHAYDRRLDPTASQLILAYRNADVALLNEAVRTARKEQGDLGPGIRIAAGSPSHAVADATRAAATHLELAATDRIVFLRNDPQGRHVTALDLAAPPGVHNGTLGTVLTAAPDRITVRLDDGRAVAFDPARYNAVAHGYALTIHRAQGATHDRVYVLLDPLMHRNAAYVALTRHRHNVDLFADSQTFTRDHLDKTLSRASRKDLASDYAAADLRRAVHRLQDLATKTRQATLDHQPFRDAAAALETLSDARRHLAATRRDLAHAAAGIYADPAAALRRILQDPTAGGRLQAGQVRAYGPLRSTLRNTQPSRAPNAGRAGPPVSRATAAATLKARLDAHARAQAGHSAAREHARTQLRGLSISPGVPTRATTPASAATRLRLPGPSTIRRGLTQTTNALRLYQQASQGAQHAIEIALRGLGRTAVNTALLLLPSKISLPVSLAVGALSRVVDKSLDLLLGR